MSHNPQMPTRISLKILHSLFHLKQRFSQVLLRKTVSYKHLAEGILSSSIKLLKVFEYHLACLWLEGHLMESFCEGVYTY